MEDKDEEQKKQEKDIYSMWIETPDIAAEAIPGQFITLYTKDADKLLPRPISLCEIDKENGRLRIVYRIAGAGNHGAARHEHYRL